MKALLVVVVVALGFAACATSTGDVEVSVDESEARLRCPSGPGVVYYATDPTVCANILFNCAEGGTPFNNECGCGCLPPPCERMGCYGEICSDTPLDPNVTLICSWNADYACYDNATCERQSDGQCGWTPSRRLDKCLAEN